MANLYFSDEDSTIKTLANVNSPEFIGTPSTVSRTNHAEKSIVNVEDALKYIDTELATFGNSVIIKAESNRLTGLIKGKKYVVSVYGKFNSGTTDTFYIGPVTIRNSSGVVLKTSGTIVKNLLNPKCMVPQSATLIIDKVPDDGILYGLVNYNTETNTGINASYMMAVRLS